MMFLSLRKRDWNKEAWVKIQSLFEGVCIPSLYLYRSWSSGINFRMPDVVEWVKGMEYIRMENVIANYQLLRARWHEAGALQKLGVKVEER